ncbi:MAG: UDP-N-acetylmuramate dehydrogenase [Microbacteriaceae bacterium]
MSENFSEYTTLQTGGQMAELFRASTEAELLDVLESVWSSGEEWMLLGGGSNMLVGSSGFDGSVILVETRGIDIVAEHAGYCLVRVAAGENWDELVAWAVSSGLSGIEALSGIPGKVGAAPVQNIGAYGAELSDVLQSIDFYDYLSGERARLAAAELELGYRSSTLKSGRAGAVISIDLLLRRVEVQGDDALGSAPVQYQQLADALKVPLGTRAGLQDVRNAVLKLRASKGMVLDANDPDSVSAGSFFTNPIVSEAFTKTLPADAPRWPVERTV